jgi:hypothetical protein
VRIVVDNIQIFNEMLRMEKRSGLILYWEKKNCRRSTDTTHKVHHITDRMIKCLRRSQYCSLLLKMCKVNINSLSCALAHANTAILVKKILIKFEFEYFYWDSNIKFYIFLCKILRISTTITVQINLYTQFIILKEEHIENCLKNSTCIYVSCMYR